MAVKSQLISNSMVIKYKVGVDSKDRELYREQKIKGLAKDITDENIITLNDNVQKVVNYPIKTIKKEQTYEITKVI